jgi:hypothetical protein
MHVRADAVRLPFADRTFDLVIGSPPYCDARTYGIGAQRDAHAWVEWMLAVTAEALRVSKGAVIWVAAGVTRDRTYWPACEGLMWEWFKAGGSAYRPCYWHRVGIPGSGGDQWYRADVEYVMCFKRAGKLPWAEPTANGHPCGYPVGGSPSNRTRTGLRVGGMKRANGTVRKHGYTAPELANPGNILKTNAGGGHTGPSFALDGNEAPYPVAVPAFFIRSHCPPGGIVLDPFGGSGTTAHAAIENGRRCVSADIRQSQCELARRRLATVNLGFALS